MDYQQLHAYRNANYWQLFLFVLALTILGLGGGMCFKAIAIDVRIDLQGAGTKPMDVAIPRFKAGEQSSSSAETADQIRDLLIQDLENSGIFHPVDVSSFYNSEGAEEGKINFRQWFLVGLQSLVAGTFSIQDDQLQLKAWIYDIATAQEIIGKSYQAPSSELRRVVHKLADEMVYRYTGELGIASSHIAFVQATGGNKEIFIMDYDGQNVRQLTNDKNLNLSPELSPDGNKVVYTSYKTGQPSIVILDLQSNAKEYIAKGGLNISPSFSNDGSMIAFSREIDGNPEIFTLSLGSKELKRLTFYNGVDSSPSWSPNARQIVFTSDRSGSPQLWIMDAEGGNLRRLTFMGEYNDGAAWSPKGDRIAFHSRQDGIFEICLINPDGSNFTQVTNQMGSAETPSWSPDGRQLIFSVGNRGSSKLHRLELGSGKIHDFKTSQGNWLSPSWSR